jgi:diguanylate cyclase (GGDEF)-like protein/PAS domain S-box-containing protein
MVYRILLVQTDQKVASSIQESLAASSESAFQVEWLQSSSACQSRLRHSNRDAGGEPREAHVDDVDAILLDLFLPDCRGIDTFNRIFSLAAHIPILIIAAPQDELAAKVAVQRGAQDYLLKDRWDAYLLPKVLRNMIERSANMEALYEEKERAEVTLNSIGDAVVSTDTHGQITFLNPVAERLTGWSRDEATGRPLEDVLVMIDSVTRERVSDPMQRAMSENKTVGLTPNCMLVRRDGVEAAIEDSVAPIHDRQGKVTGAVMVFHDVTAARALSARTAHLAQHDSLTDLPNRLLLNDRLAQATALAHRGGQQLAILYLDVDRFKTINDSLGHAIGDRLLQSVAQRLSHCVRLTDTVSRQGGDEFVILLSQLTNAQDAAVSAEKILVSLAAPHFIEEHSLYVTASIGVATFPDDGVTADALLKNADFAMYRAKEKGRNCFQFFTPEMNTSVIRRQAMENGLRSAIDRQSFSLHYQPKFNLRTGAITSVEALVRWRHPTRGLLLPGEFMPIAEESGLIVPLGRWVLREACRQGKAWRELGLKPIKMAINISAVELRSQDFVKNVRAILEKTGFDPGQLELELTETFLMRDVELTLGVLEQLKSLGMNLALDDFGTGYSSLSYLRKFPIDTLKVDDSFLRNVTHDGDNASIVKAIIYMGKSMRMRVVAEGVESAEQLAFLQENECLEGQGYFLARPLNASHFADLLAREATASRPWGDASTWSPASAHSAL